jgi:hypothetical protein
MAVSTVEGHLAHFVGKGELDLKSLVIPEKIAVISEWFLRKQSINLAVAKAELGNHTSYSELRFVLNYLQYTNQITF